VPYNSYRFSCERVQLKRLSFLSKLSIILNCHSEKGPFLSMREGVLRQTAAGRARHAHARVHRHSAHAPQPPRATGADASDAAARGVSSCPSTGLAGCLLQPFAPWPGSCRPCGQNRAADPRPPATRGRDKGLRVSGAVLLPSRAAGVAGSRAGTEGCAGASVGPSRGSGGRGVF